MNRTDDLVAGWARSMGYEVLHALAIKPDQQVLKVQRRGGEYALKGFFGLSEPVLESRMLAYKVIVPTLRGGQYRRLIVPNVIQTKQFGEPGQSVFGEAVVLEWIDGRDFNDRWSEDDEPTAGGRAIPIESTALVLDLIEDFQSIDAEQFLATGIANIDGRAAVNDARNNHLKNVVADDDLTEDQLQQICELLAPLNTDAHYQISNGDFQFRNFIEVDARTTAVVDWDGTRLSTYELEHCIAYQWLLMWHNQVWQSVFLNLAKDRFNLDRDRFRAVALYRVLGQGLKIWKDRKDWRRIMVDCAKDLLRDEYVDSIWG